MAPARQLDSPDPRTSPSIRNVANSGGAKLAVCYARRLTQPLRGRSIRLALMGLLEDHIRSNYPSCALDATTRWRRRSRFAADYNRRLCSPSRIIDERPAGTPLPSGSSSLRTIWTQNKFVDYKICNGS